MEFKTLKEVWLNPFTYGIFHVLQNSQAFPDIPWLDDNIDQELDYIYFGNHSGERIVSPLLYNFAYGPNPITWNVLRETMGEIIYNLFIKNWVKQWNTMELNYNPIENYSMVEQMANDQTIDAYGKTRTRTNNLSHTKTGTETDTPNTTETQTPNLTNTRKTETHGFNSEQSVNMDADRQTATGTNTITRTGQEQRTYNTFDADTGTQTENDGGQDTHTRNYRLTRSGNIGVTTSQQMIISERELWKWNFFYDIVFPDIDRVLTIQIY